MITRVVNLGTIEEFIDVPVIDTAIYAAGDSLGGLITFEKAKPIDGIGTIKRILISDAQSFDTEIDVLIFDRNPTASTITNNAPIAIAAADLSKLVGIKNISAYTTFSANSTADIAVDIPLTTFLKDRSIYVAMMEQGTPTRAVGDITIKLVIEWDGQGDVDGC